MYLVYMHKQYKKIINLDELLCHEEIIPEKYQALLKYATNLSVPSADYTVADIIPPIIIDSKVNVIIDGHHRYHVYRALHIPSITVYAVDYLNFTNIIVHPTNTDISKLDVISAALSHKLFSAKTTKHMTMKANTNTNITLLPIISLVLP